MKRKRDLLAKILVLAAISVPILANQIEPQRVSEYQVLSSEFGASLLQKLGSKKFLIEQDSRE